VLASCIKYYAALKIFFQKKQVFVYLSCYCYFFVDVLLQPFFMENDEQTLLAEKTLRYQDIPGINQVTEEAVRSERQSVNALSRHSEEWINSIIEFVRAFCVHFCRQHKEETGKDADICAHNPYQIKVPRLDDPELTMASIDRMRSHVKNYEELRDQFREQTAQIEEQIKSGKNALIITNHMTLAGIPLIISLLLTTCEDPKQMLESLWTILGPSLMTNATERQMILAITNVLVTQPPTVNGKVPGYDMKQGRLKVGFSRNLQALSEESGIGKIFLLAPSGTRDKKEYHEGVLKKVQMKSSSGRANKIVAGLQNTSILPIVIDEDLYAGRVAKAKNVKITFAPMVPNQETCLDEQMGLMASLVCDEYGQQIAELY
jgi:hypothetical protein